MTHIFVDADACPVVRLVEQAAAQFALPVTLLCDTNHILHSDYSEVKVIGAGADAVDFALVNLCRRGDVVVTQDYGVAAMALGKGAYAIHQSGRLYTEDNIDQLLMERHSFTAPADLYIVTPNFKKPHNTAVQQLTFENKHITDQLAKPSVQQRWVKTSDGKQMLTWIILPPNFDETKK